ncbi:HNH endonuclease signature motif containing protein, partial [Mycobacterium intermedium]|uniref:HNH endonuclease signature motif containing protein n=1 Tax=Mycobacterium intermedium TaxID=28445 RepID=UPI003D15FC85
MDENLTRREALTNTTAETTRWLDRTRAAARIENQAAAAQLLAIGELFAHRFAHCAYDDNWVIDAMAAVAAEVGAGLRISRGLAMSRLHYARVMRERLPKTGDVFRAGDIDFRAFATIAHHTDAIEDPAILARVDELIAENVGRWPSLSRGRLAAQVDKIVAGHDRDALRRREKQQADREVWIGGDQDGISRIEGTFLTPDAHALDKRLSALAATVCPHDPRTREQRRADALGALAAGADRLACRCQRTDCTAASKKKPASPVAIHVIAEHATLNGTNTTPASEVSADGLITPELLGELAQSATLVPVAHPGYCAPEPHYRPSKALADFVKCRDLTCRWPGCEVPAWDCQLDHTIPYAQGGPTHAGNMKCYCTFHHLVKTFLGWTEKQLADGTLILTSPGGDTHVTTPGSALLFPSLCQAVGGMPCP